MRKAATILGGYLDEDSADLDAIFLLSETYYLEGCSVDNPNSRMELFQKQLACAERGLEINPDHVLCLSSKAVAHMRLGEFRRTQEALTKLLSLDHSFSVGQYTAACLAALTRNAEKALHHLSIAISINPDWKDFAKEDPDFTHYFHDAQWQNLVYQ